MLPNKSYDMPTWVIELERGWAPWTPGDVPVTEIGDSPVPYCVGKSKFEAQFSSDSEGTQTNLTTGKVRRLLLLQPGQAPPAWEGIGARRRPTAGTGRTSGTKGTAVAAVGSAAMVAQAARDARRTAGDYNGLHSTSGKKPAIGGRSQASRQVPPSRTAETLSVSKLSKSGISRDSVEAQTAQVGRDSQSSADAPRVPVSRSDKQCANGDRIQGCRQVPKPSTAKTLSNSTLPKSGMSWDAAKVDAPEAPASRVLLNSHSPNGQARAPAHTKLSAFASEVGQLQSRSRVLSHSASSQPSRPTYAPPERTSVQA